MPSLLVTGGAGFIGSNFVRHWRRAHPRDPVIVLDLLTYAGNRTNLDGAPDVRLVVGDIGDRALVARTLRDAGMDVVYSGLHRTPEEVVNTAIQEDVDVLGVSLLSGVQLTVFPKLFKLLEDRGANDIIVIAGGQGQG